MRLVLILSLILSYSSSFAQGAKVNPPESVVKYKKKFEAETGITPGEYVLSSSSPQDGSCLDGRLSVQPSKEDIAIILGARALVVGLGTEKIVEKSDDCTLTYKSSYNKNIVNETREEICKDGRFTAKTTVTIEKEKISYVKSLSRNDKDTATFTCVATLDKSTAKKTEQ